MKASALSWQFKSFACYIYRCCLVRLSFGNTFVFWTHRILGSSSLSKCTGRLVTRVLREVLNAVNRIVSDTIFMVDHLVVE